MEILLICVVVIIIIVAHSFDKKAKQRRNNEVVKENLNREFERGTTQQKGQIAEKGTIGNENVNAYPDFQELLKRETNDERREFIQHIINTEDLRHEMKELNDFLFNDDNKERYPEEYEKKTARRGEVFNELKQNSNKLIANCPQDVMKSYKKSSKAFDANMYEFWFVKGEHESLGVKGIELKDAFVADGGIGAAHLGYNNPNFHIEDKTFYLFPMYAVVCKNDVSDFDLVNIEDLSVSYEYQEFTEKKNLIGSCETSRHLYPCDYWEEGKTHLYSKDVISNKLYGILTIHPFDITLYVSNISQGAKIEKAFNEYIDLMKSKKGLASENHIKTEVKQERDEPDEPIIVSQESEDSFSDNETIEITYTVFGYDRLGDTTFDMEVKDKEYEWLQDAEGEEGELSSDYISENRPSLHKRIMKAIRNNMQEEGYEPDDGMVETYVSGVHRKEFYEDASYEHASDFAEDDEIEYTVTI